METILTNHARIRIRQRGFCEKDMSILLQYGSRMESGVLMLTDHDVRREVNAMRTQIIKLERLRGTIAVIADGRVITVYRATRRLRPRFESGER